MNIVVLQGRLTADPEVRYTQDGLAIASHSLAVDRPRKKDADPVSDFFQCSSFGKAAEFAGKYLKKGTKILVAGSLQQDNWTDKNGNKRSTIKVVVNQYEFCESRKEQDRVPDNEGGFVDLPEGTEDELPFKF